MSPFSGDSDHFWREHPPKKRGRVYASWVNNSGHLGASQSWKRRSPIEGSKMKSLCPSHKAQIPVLVLQCLVVDSRSLTHRLVQQGSLHTPEQCNLYMVVSPYFGVEQATCFKWLQTEFLFRRPVQNPIQYHSGKPLPL